MVLNPQGPTLPLFEWEKIFLFNQLIFKFVTVLSSQQPHCRAQAFSGSSEQGLLSSAVSGLTAEASLLAEHGLWGTGSVAVLHSLAGLPWWHNWQRTHLPTQETQILSLGGKDPWRRKWQPTPVFLPGKPHGQRSLAGYSPWGSRRTQTQLSS